MSWLMRAFDLYFSVPAHLADYVEGKNQNESESQKKYFREAKWLHKHDDLARAVTM